MIGNVRDGVNVMLDRLGIETNRGSPASFNFAKVNVMLDRLGIETA
jgi:hypothetical protein